MMTVWEMVLAPKIEDFVQVGFFQKEGPRLSPIFGCVAPDRDLIDHTMEDAVLAFMDKAPPTDGFEDWGMAIFGRPISFDGVSFDFTSRQPD